MSTIITMKDGRREYIIDDRDFAELIYKELGLEAYDYFKEVLEDAEDWRMREDTEDCFGECDKVYETQAHYESILQYVRDELASWKMKNWKKSQLEQKRDELYEYINKQL